MSGAPTPDPFSARQLQALTHVIRSRLSESLRFPRAEQIRNVRLAKTVAVSGSYPSSGNTFAIRFVDAGFSPKSAGTTTIGSQERTAEGDTDDAEDVIAREINGKYVPVGSYVAALWQRGLEGDPDDYGEWWIRLPTDQPPCDYCSADSDTITVTLAGIGNNICTCSGLNGTYVLTRDPTNACVWRATLSPWTCTPIGLISGTITAHVTSQFGQYRWFATVTLYHGLTTYTQARWTWSSGGSTPFDCTATRTLATHSLYELSAVCSWGSATCQIN